MGLLSLGTPLSWDQVSQYVDHVRQHGIVQLLNTIAKYKNRDNDEFLWGDETEYVVVKLSNGKATLSLRQEEILGALMNASQDGAADVDFHPEYGRFMVEATPARPYDGTIAGLLEPEPNMEKRREIAAKYLDPGESLLSITSYPLLGVGKFVDSKESVKGPATKSLFLPDDVINLHPRFPTLSSNIRQRRGKKVEIAVPVYKDKNTVFPWKDPLATKDEIPSDIPPNSIYMDAMGFGMGCCCLQITMQGKNMDQARDIYDGLVPIAPLLLAMSAASPIFRGVLADQDVRWNVVSSAVDDRTDEEKKRVPKSRYDSVDCYISRTNAILHEHAEFYNDIDVPTNPKVIEQLKNSPVSQDPLLIKHFSHLFIRDPLVIFEELINQDDENSMDHFENIQSTNWQTVRFKPPPNNNIGWRTEFRPMEIQFTDFENAAYSVFVVLLARALLELDLCFYQPISQIDANMHTAHKRDPIRRGLFWIRTNVKGQTADSVPGFKLLSLDVIFNGGTEFVGLIPLVKEYLSTQQLDKNTSEVLENYLTLLSMRANSQLKTNAQWTRDFVHSHPDYKEDSIISEKIAFDLLSAIDKISSNNSWEEIQKFAKF